MRTHILSMEDLEIWIWRGIAMASSGMGGSGMGGSSLPSIDVIVLGSGRVRRALHAIVRLNCAPFNYSVARSLSFLMWQR